MPIKRDDAFKGLGGFFCPVLCKELDNAVKNRHFFYVILALFLFLVAPFAFADEIIQPVPPTSPVNPVSPGASGSTGLPRPPPPPPPVIPGNSQGRPGSQSDRPVQEIRRHDLVLTEAFPNGDTKNNTADTIKDAQCTLYSNGAIALKISFANGEEYTYHLRNPRLKFEMGMGVFRETFDVAVQAGKNFLLEQYVGELFYDDDTILSFVLTGNNKVMVQLKFAKKG